LGTRCHIDTARIIDGARFLLELLACSVNFRLRLTGCQLLGKIWRASCAQIRLCIPTDLMTNPVSAARALPEIRTGFLNCACQGRIVKFATDDTLDLVGRGSHSTPAAQKVTGNVQQGFGNSDR
jgi:hypothetical protein